MKQCFWEILLNLKALFMSCSCLFCGLWWHIYWWPSMSYLSYTWRTLSLPDFEFKLALSALTHQFTSSSYLPHWHRRASEVWNWWRCACENVSGGSLAREREYILEGGAVEGVTDRSGKSSFSWTLNCKMEDPVQTMAVINRLWWEASRKSPMPARTRWKRERKKNERGMETEGVTERDTGRDEVCVTISLGKESQGGREQKERMCRVEKRMGDWEGGRRRYKAF